MAFLKPTTSPDFGFPISYFRIDTIDRLCQIRREAQFRVNAYMDAATAAVPGMRGLHHGGVIEVKGPVFDLYFSRTALTAAGKSVHAQAYQLVKDYNVAVALSDAAKTPAQMTLTMIGQVRIANDLGGAAFFKDAADA